MMRLFYFVCISALFPSVFCFECPQHSDSCLLGIDVYKLPKDPQTVCVSLADKLIKASECIKVCKFIYPANLINVTEYISSVCSATSGCEKYDLKVEGLKTCFGSKEQLSQSIDTMVAQFNSLVSTEKQCLKLRQVRSCMKSMSKRCSLLTSLSYHLLTTLPKLDLALVLCGAENVETSSNNEKCSQETFMKVERQCSVACQLTHAQNVGDFCALMQFQINCILGHSKGCDLAKIKYLLPRVDTYSLSNQLFSCQIKINGVLARPLQPSTCDLRGVISQCFGLPPSDQVLFEDIQRLVNLDFSNFSFCQHFDFKKKAVDDCIKGFWSCYNPLSYYFKLLNSSSSAFDSTFSDFVPKLGIFPLNPIGLTKTFNQCSVPPYYAQSVCPSSYKKE